MKKKSLTSAVRGFNQSTAEEICERIAGGESLRAICGDSRMPGRTTVCRWLGESPDFQRAMSLARGIQADVLAEEILQIADDEVDPIRARVRIDARRWYASKVAPKKYGERVEIEANDNLEIRVVMGGNA